MARRNRPRPSTTSHQPLVHWWGEQLAPHSLAYVNRELCRRLVERPTLRVQLLGSSARYDDGEAAVDPSLEPLRRRIRTHAGRNPDVTVRHHWPPDLEPPAGSGPLVVCQPWEFGALPASWVDPMNEVVDEVWCYSSYVRDVYERSGVDPSKLVVLPLGVDTARFRPDGPRLDLPTDKSVKLLFVGGTLHRKGIDLLLRAYTQAFRASDDVALVVKASDGGGSYQGATLHDTLAELRANDPDAPEIVYLHGDRPHDEVAALYRSCDALVHAYRGEGFGLPVVEAMASGLPVVVTVGGATDDFCAADRALLVPARELPYDTAPDLPAPSAPGYSLLEPDVDALVEQLRRVAAGGDDLRAIADRGRSWVTEHLRWDASVDIAADRLLDLASRPARRLSDRPAAARRGAETLVHGVNVVGFLTGDYGLSEAARLLVESIEHAGVPVATRTIELANRKGTVPFRERGDGTLPYSTTLWAVQPELLAEAMGTVPAALRAGRRNVGYWFWESEVPTARMHDAAPLLDELWVGSEFIAIAARQVFTTQVHVVTPPIVDPGAVPIGRRELGLPDDRFLFLFEFDHLSVSARKNPEAAVGAFETAFSPGDGPVLVIKALNGRVAPEAHAALLAVAERRSDVVVLEERLSAEANHALIACCDAYVSLHRAEGLGLTLAEAMVRGKPVVATGWSGNLDFMTGDVAELVPYELRLAGPPDIEPHGVYPSGTRWAEADVAAAAAAMRRLVDDPEAATSLGRRAAAHIAANHGHAARGDQVRRALAPAPSAAPLLSACMIVKDEEHLLPDCLASIAELVDEVIVYDTGSSDGTRAVAAAAGARVVDGYWSDDFGRARNAALAECRGRWVLHIDADERFAGNATSLRRTLTATSTDGLSVTIENLGDSGDVDAVHDAVRLFRRERGHWAGRLHEQVVARTGQPRVVTAHCDAGTLRHLGYQTELLRSRGKGARNVAIAGAELASGNGDSGELLLNLARSLALDGRLDEALARCDEVRELAQCPERVRRFAAHFRVDVLLALGRAEEALAGVAELRANGEPEDFCTILEDRAKLLLGDLEAAARLSAGGSAVSSVGFGAQGNGVRVSAAVMLAEAGNWADAGPALLEVVREAPGQFVWGHVATAVHAGAVDAAAATAAVTEPFLRSVLTQLLLAPPAAADAFGEALAARWPDDPRLLAFAVHLAPKLELGQALEWTARLRSVGFTDSCPLAAIARDTSRDAMDRLRALAVANGAFGDVPDVRSVGTVAAAVATDSFLAALVELDGLAPALLPAFVEACVTDTARTLAMAAVLNELGATDEAAALRNSAGSLKRVG